MKLSKYNYFFKPLNKFVVYNSFSASLIELEDELYNDLVNNNFANIAKKTLSELVELSIIVYDDNILINKLKFEIYKSRYDRENLHLTITPTYFCNFNCSYCYEDNRPKIFMSENTIQNLISFVKEKKVSNLTVTWYGGEPLLAFDKIVKLTTELKKIVKTFSAHIVTNGYLLTPDKIKLLKDLNIEEIQITLDGPPEIHNIKRPLQSGKETFNKIINNTKSVLKETNINVVIRVNIDKKNSDYYYSFQKYLLNEFNSEKLFIYPAMIHNFEDNKSCLVTTGCLLDKNEYSKFLIEQFNKNKNINLNYFPSPPDIECMAKHINAFLIGADGDIYKCWLDIGNKNKRIGNINDATIKNYNVLSMYMVEMDVFEDEKCSNCILLPSCVGGCPNERIAAKVNKHIDYCSPMIKDLESFLKIQYKIETKSI